MAVDSRVAPIFFPTALASPLLRVFVVADAALFVFGSAWLAFAMLRQHASVDKLAWTVVGAVGYAALCCVGLLLVGGRLLAVGAMAAAFAGTLSFAIAFRSGANRATS